MSEKVYLVDGSGYIFRAFYAVAPLSTSKGFPTNALYGFTRMLLRLLKESNSEHVVVVFDAGRETFRTELYKEYKANRSECPPELSPQMPFFREITDALGLPLWEQKGFEADDIIGTLTDRLTRAGHEVVIVSGDKDLMQLVSDRVTMWDTLKERRYGPNEVKEKLGIGPERVVDLLGLMGDSSDNVPGLSGVGPKTALQLLEKYGDIESIISSAKLIAEDPTIRNRKKISECVESQSELLRLSRRLVEIDRHVPLQSVSEGGGSLKEGNGKQSKTSQLMSIDMMPDEELLKIICRKTPESSHLKALIDKFEFASLFRELGVKNNNWEAPSEVSYRTIWRKDFAEWLPKFKERECFSFDLETTSLDSTEAEVVGISVCWSAKEAFYIPLGHVEGQSEQLTFAEFSEVCAPIFGDPRRLKYGQNLKYDMSVFESRGVEVNGVVFDTMVAAYLLNPDRPSYGLTALAHEYLSYGVIEYEELVGDKPHLGYVDVEAVTRYACQDAHYAWLLVEKLHPKLKAEKLLPIFEEIEMPLVSVLSRMERKGVKLDTPLLAQISRDFSQKLNEIKGRLFEMAGCEFNINSPKQLAQVLFEKLGLSTKGLRKTKTGVSTDADVLERLSAEHPLPGLILEYRLLFKLLSTYVDALPRQISAFDGRLHSNFRQTGTGTGRLSSSEPNLQNIPIQTAEGRMIRRAFIPEEGSVLISADYSQIELRLLAHMSADENLIRAFQEGVDIHAQTAREILNLGPIGDVPPDLRRIGKTINFGIIYGMGPYRLSRELGIPVNVATRYIESYFAHYARVKELFAKLSAEAESEGKVTTLFGRRRVLADIDSSGRDDRFISRAALNAPIQGSAADIIKLAMVRIDCKIREKRYPMSMILQIHDELVFECMQSFKEEGLAFICREMEGVAELKVPLKVDAGCGYNWDEIH